MKKLLFRPFMAAMLILAACSKPDNDKDDDPGGGGNTDPVTISGTNPEFVFWGEPLTINGSGFSTVKADNFVWFKGINDCGTSLQDSTDWNKAEVLTATPDKLVVSVPFTTYNGMA